MVKLWSSSLVLVVAVLVLASSAFAAEGKKKGEHKRPSVEQMAAKIFEKLDTNKDGDLSLKEFAAGRHFKGDETKAKKAYETIKKDKDGKVTVKEFTEWLKERRAQRSKEGGKRHKKAA